MARQDVHRPSAINPADYDFVAYDYIGPQNYSGLSLVTSERAKWRDHMKKTGGKFSTHDHGGTCMVCGARAFYVARFWHRPTNEYLTIGHECADKMHLGDPKAFKKFQKNAHTAFQAQAGKAKAEAYLKEQGLDRAWGIYENGYTTDEKGRPVYEENTIRDIVSKLITYGSISTAQKNFLASLLGRIDRREEAKVKREEEQANAHPVPLYLTENRHVITGKIVSVKLTSSLYGEVWKILVVHKYGWKLWGPVPHGILNDSTVPVNELKGKYVTFKSRVTVSKDDPKFGFFSRPSAAKLITEAEAEKLFTTEGEPKRHITWGGRVWTLD